MLNSPLLCTIACCLLVGGCCSTYTGYGRYTLKKCDSVKIGDTTYKLTKPGSEFVLDGHTISRGIYRKTKPWLYVHRVDSNEVELTVESGLKPVYPLYTGSSASIFDTFAHPWELEQSTCAAFDGDYWLVSHRWASDGIFFDLQKKGGSNTDWTLVDPEVFVPSDGTPVEVPQISSQVEILTFDASAKKASVRFTELPP